MSEPTSVPQTTSPSPTPKNSSPLITLGVVVAVIAIGIGIFFGLRSDDESPAEGGSTDTETQAGTWYISQMHPWIIQPEPGQCPICGMDLTPVDPDRFAGEMTIDPVIVQNMGVRVKKAEIAPISRKIRTVGIVTIDPSRVSDINLRFTGWVEKVHVQAQWDHVKSGAPLLDIYSPELLSAEKEYTISLKAQGSLSNKTLLAAARKRLVLLGMPNAEIQRLENGGAAQEVITLTAPHDGIVLQKNVNNGSKVTPQTLAYQIADLSQIWVEATIYEQHLPFVHLHQDARIQLSYGDKRVLHGKIAYIYPVVDKNTRETKARFVFDNSDGMLKPDMFATVEIMNESAPMVRIAQEAVIGTGKRNIVFVSLGRGRFEPRTVVTGPRGGAYIGIKEGIQDGEQVVVSGQFLLDSESKMREALAKVMKGDLASQQQAAVKKDDSEKIHINTESMTAFKNVLDQYLQWQQGLYKDDVSRARVSLEKFKPAFDTFLKTAQAFDEHIHHRLPPIESLKNMLSEKPSETLSAYRTLFGNISVELNLIITSLGIPNEFANNLSGMRCSMAKEIRDGGVWIQYGPDVKNPYFGLSSDMRNCAADTWGFAAKSEMKDLDTKSESEKKPLNEKTIKTSQSAIPSNAIAAYLAIQDALYMNDLQQAQNTSKDLNASLSAAGDDWSKTADLTHGVMHAENLSEARIAFGQISIVLRDHLQAHGNANEEIRVFKCGMARGVAEKGIWIQVAGEVKNPYFGHESGMSDCFTTEWKTTNKSLTEVE